ncbi:MAG: hypothetical protein K2M57_01525 [Paramuribaculum sp.]|nr:hypothetical protein [Paramuribaculum sp.]
MKIAVAPHMPVVAEATRYDRRLASLDLPALSRQNNVSFLVPENWVYVLAGNSDIASDYELFSLLLELPVVPVSSARIAAHLRLDPDILDGCPDEVKNVAELQLFAMGSLSDCRRIYAGTAYPADKFEVVSGRLSVGMMHFRPGCGGGLKALVDSFEPVLDQQKHYHEARQEGGREVSAFSAYDKNDESYARWLLHQAYEDYDGDIDDRTYLYTYDAKYKTFVEFRPDRGNKYHGRDIDIDYARREAADVVKRFNQ